MGQRLVIAKNEERDTKVTTYNNNASTNPFSPKVSPNFSSKLRSDPKTIRNYQIYIVKEGDTLFNISRKFPDVTIEELRNWNNLTEVRYLKPGKKLKIFKS